MSIRFLVDLTQKRRVPRRAESGMTLLETSLSLLFMAMFCMALLAASMGLNRMTRGYTCRVLSSDQSATKPTRGCGGEDDEIFGTDVNRLRLEHLDALRALRDDIRSTQKPPINIAISPRDVAFRLASDRYNLQRKKCLWEKLEPIKDGRFRAYRNYFIIDPSPDPRALGVVSTDTFSANQGGHVHVWFIRAGHLIGEQWKSSDPKSKQPKPQALPGLASLDDNLISDPSFRFKSTSYPPSYQELAEPSGSLDPILNAPNTGWGLLNQVCLYRAGNDTVQNIDLSTLYLLSGERGRDLGTQDTSFFGRETGLSSRQSQPRLLFSMQ